jgi:hypothetical protein
MTAPPLPIAVYLTAVGAYLSWVALDSALAWGRHWRRRRERSTRGFEVLPTADPHLRNVQVSTPPADPDNGRP